MGFEITHTEYSPKFFGNWSVELESTNCVIYIVNDRDAILVDFSPVGNKEVNNRFDIGTMIYFLSSGRENIGPYEGNLAWGQKKQFQRMAVLLKKYLDKIVPYFGKNYINYRDKIILAREEYLNRN